MSLEQSPHLLNAVRVDPLTCPVAFLLLVEDFVIVENLQLVVTAPEVSVDRGPELAIFQNYLSQGILRPVRNVESSHFFGVAFVHTQNPDCVVALMHKN